MGKKPGDLYLGTLLDEKTSAPTGEPLHLPSHQFTTDEEDQKDDLRSVDHSPGHGHQGIERPHRSRLYGVEGAAHDHGPARGLVYHTVIVPRREDP